MKTILTIPALFAGLSGLAAAASISVNFRIGANDNNSVNADESATSLVPVSGAN